MVNSNEKGADFERKICKVLSLWVSHQHLDDIFWRSSMSGGRATIGARAGRARKHQQGDISAVHPLGMQFLSAFGVECKHLKSLELGLSVFQMAGEMFDIWDKPYCEAKNTGREPFIVAKQNFKPELLMTTQRGLKLLRGAWPDLDHHARVRRRIDYPQFEKVAKVKAPADTPEETWVCFLWFQHLLTKPFPPLAAHLRDEGIIAKGPQRETF